MSLLLKKEKKKTLSHGKNLLSVWMEGEGGGVEGSRIELAKNMITLC